MSTFIDKLNIKLTKSQSIKSFDQSFIKIKVVSGYSQLCSIKLDCTWVYSHLTQRPPQLSCQWFNKTQNSMTLIQGITGTYYQPSLCDVGTTIYVQCLPELPQSEYQGMPIIQQIGPINLDNQTQQQTNDLLLAGKATFSCKIKLINQKPESYDALIKIHGNTFRIVTRSNDQQKQIINIRIEQANPIIKCHRSNPKQLEMYVGKGSAKQQLKIGVEVSNNKVRDILMLLVKLISITEQKQKNKIKQLQELAKIQQQQQSSQLIKNVITTQDNIQPLTQKQPIDLQKNNQISTQKPQQKQKLPQQQNLTKNSSNNQPQLSTPQKSKQTQGSEQQLQQSNQSTTNKNPKSSSKTNQVKSSQDFTSPITKKCNNFINEQTTSKSNTFDSLLISDLKKQIRANQTQLLQLKKQTNQQNQLLLIKQQQINIIKQREINFSKNYFQIQSQLTSLKLTYNKLVEEISYYRNQNHLIKIQSESINKQNKYLNLQINTLNHQLKPFLQQIQHSQNMLTYQQIKSKYTQQIQQKKQLQTKYQCIKQQSLKIEQKYNQLKQMMQRFQNEKNFYKKKYQNLTQQFHSYTSTKSIHSPTSPLPQQKYQNISLIKSCTSLTEFEESSTSNPIASPLNQQLQMLKKQLQQKNQQINFLKSLNAASTKIKQSTSKHQLKLQLLQMKKIVNRLTQTVTQKDLALQNFKNINREISQKLLNNTKKLNALQINCGNQNLL